MASLLVMHGMLAGEYFLLPDDAIVSVGRDDQCTLQLLDPSISRKHLQLRYDSASGNRVAADYRSANGVKVNGSKLTGADVTNGVQLKDGDQISLGKTLLVYLEANHPDAKSAKDAVHRRNEWKRSTLEHNE